MTRHSTVQTANVEVWLVVGGARVWLTACAGTGKEEAEVMEFAIPLCREELLKDDGKGTYAVKECLASVELVRHIDGKEFSCCSTKTFPLLSCFIYTYLQSASLCLLKLVLLPS